MAQTEWYSFHANRLRITKLDVCGNPVYGTASTLVTKGIIKGSIGYEWEDGEEINQKEGGGGRGLVNKDDPYLKFVTAEIEFTKVLPEALSMTTGMPIVADGAGNAVGFRLNNQPITANVALELWSDVGGVACGTGAKPYGYFLIPFLGSGKLGNIELQISEATFTITAESKDGTQWGAGPYDVVLDDEDALSPLLTPLTVNDHFHSQMTLVPPPAVTAGAVALTAPVGP